MLPKFRVTGSHFCNWVPLASASAALVQLWRVDATE